MYDKFIKPEVRLTRRNLYSRDKNRCQYCGQRFSATDLTLDHVVPRVRGGGHHWTNVVAACKRRNHRKAGRTPEEAGMVLLSQPKPPSGSPYQRFQTYLREREEWRRFVPAIESA